MLRVRGLEEDTELGVRVLSVRGHDFAASCFEIAGCTADELIRGRALRGNHF